MPLRYSLREPKPCDIVHGHGLAVHPEGAVFQIHFAGDAVEGAILPQAGVGIGLFPSLADAVSHISVSQCIEPQAADYAQTRKRYAMLYPALYDVFHQ